jgi:hypothetical protein
MSNNNKGIVERAKAAASHEELANLEEEFKGYSFASAQTISRFRRAVKRRSKEINESNS